MSGYRRQFPDGTADRMRELIKMAKTVAELKRIQCIYFRAKFGFLPEQIADMVGLEVGTVWNLHSAFLQNGESALEITGKGGRYHSYLTVQEETSWLAEHRKGGETGEILEVSRVKQSFEQRIGRKVAKSTVYDLLHRHGWRKIMPRPSHPKSDLEAMDNFKKTSVKS
jgi:transposase